MESSSRKSSPPESYEKRKLFFSNFGLARVDLGYAYQKTKMSQLLKGFGWRALPGRARRPVPRRGKPLVESNSLYEGASKGTLGGELFQEELSPKLKKQRGIAPLPIT